MKFEILVATLDRMNEVKKYALGHYGRLLAPVQPDVLDRIVDNGSGEIRREPAALEPAVPALRAKGLIVSPLFALGTGLLLEAQLRAHVSEVRLRDVLRATCADSKCVLLRVN